MSHWILILHLAATLFMTGVIWFVQVVHYPLYRLVGVAQFAAYESSHTFRTTFVVAPPMLIEMVTAVWMLWQRPDGISAKSLWLNFILLIVIWLSTALVQSPIHGVLTKGYNERAIQLLVLSNLLRTVCWSARSIIVCSWVMNLLSRC
ncbi:MAG: hypothetical protein NZ805_07420 [Armatimonadetes bacterium]|nr:hypothetical protein [Armatimonadota bacterium]MDW8028350.1 hypothetical protein [Armatimonadota bacterium]